MKPIEKNELYQHVNQFLKKKGVEVKEGPYAKQLEKSCGLLTDAINLTQKGMERAKTEIDKRLEQVRQVIHEKTAPRSSAQSKPQTDAPPTNAAPPNKRKKSTGRRPQSAKAKKSRNAKKR